VRWIHLTLTGILIAFIALAVFCVIVILETLS